MLDVASAPTFADAQAAITWSVGGLDLHADRPQGLKNLAGRGSGETIQMAFSGAGWVLVQPSEGRLEGGGTGGGSSRAAACSATC